MDHVKVSVCIPVYNGAEHLAETLKSVIGQSFVNFEILLQDNCSNDSTPQIIEAFMQVDSRIKVERNQEVFSMARNWNVAIDRATSDYVLLLSADDLIDTDFLKTCVDTLDADQRLDLVSTEHRLLTKHGTRKRRITATPGKHTMSMANVLLKNPLSINFTVFRKEILDRLRMPSGRLFREPYFTCDYDLWIRIAAANGRFYFVETPLASYRVHDGSLSSKKLKMLKHTVLTLSANVERISEKTVVAHKITYIRMFVRLLRLGSTSSISSRRIQYLIIGRLFG